MKKPRHIHIGAGKIGLGLVVPTTHKCGFEVVVLNRRSGVSGRRKHSKNEYMKSRKDYILRELEYDVRIDSLKEIRRDEVQYCAFCTFPEGTDRIDPGVEDRISGKPTATLITTSVGIGNLSRVVPLVSRIIRLHISACGVLEAKRSPVFVTACENGPRVTNRLKEEVTQYHSSRFPAQELAPPNVVFTNSLVDRTVSKDPKLVDGTLCLGVEEYCQWIMEIPRPRPPKEPYDRIKRLLQKGGVNFVSSQEFSDWETKKYVCLNGLHLALATIICWHKHLEKRSMAELDRVESFSQGLTVPFVRSKIAKVQQELVDAVHILSNHSISKADAKSYASNVLERMKRLKDPYYRAFQDLVRSSDQIGEIAKEESALLKLIYDAKVRDLASGRIDRQFRRGFELYINAISIDPFISKLDERITSPLFALCAGDTRESSGGDFKARELLLFEVLAKAVRIIKERASFMKDFMR